MTTEFIAAPGRRAVQLSWRSALVLAVASAAGLVMLLWPLFINPAPGETRIGQPFVFLLLLPVVVLVVIAEITEGGMDSKAIAILGVHIAINAALRPLGAGTAGIEVVFFLIVLGGRVFGAGFGFVLGAASLFASALITAGVGPWLPFQMLCAAWVGLFAGLLPRTWFGRPIRGGTEIAMLVVYGVVAAYGYGLLMNLTSWPYSTGFAVPGATNGLQLVPGDPVLANLHRFIVFTALTSLWGWDTGRAITNAVLIVVLGPAILATLRRAARRARYIAG